MRHWHCPWSVYDQTYRSDAPPPAKLRVSAASILDRVDQDEWDIAFLAADPAREDRLPFSPAYALIEGTLVVREGTPYRPIQDADAEGVKCVTRNAAYDLYLSRRLAHAKIVHASTPAESLDLL
ncbi:hypothetical protein LJR255_003997 [Pararhizobium sp. LjRoot255]|uniref:hypothetical protein n=1 Tax=Pararhizobium sp. LjRoot255 TaxID=3342298 RepID=UPI003ECFF51B